jgi:hypothetical protein
MYGQKNIKINSHYHQHYYSVLRKPSTRHASILCKLKKVYISLSVSKGYTLLYPADDPSSYMVGFTHLVQVECMCVCAWPLCMGHGLVVSFPATEI